MCQDRHENAKIHCDSHHGAHTRRNPIRGRFENVRNDYRAYRNEHARRNHDHTRDHDRRGHYQQPQHQLGSELQEGVSNVARNSGLEPFKYQTHFALCFIYLGLFATVAFQGCILAYQITRVTKRATHTDDSTPEFSQYKDSLFESCSENTTTEDNCALIEVDLTGGSLTQQWVEDHGMEKEDNHFSYRPYYRVYSSSANGPQASTNTNGVSWQAALKASRSSCQPRETVPTASQQ